MLPMLLLSAIRGVLAPPPKSYGTSTFRNALQTVLISLADGFASTGVVFAGLEGGRVLALWLCAGAAALAGFYSLPIRYSQHFDQYPALIKLYAGNGRIVIAALLTGAVGGGMYLMRNDGDASVYAVFALVPPLLLFVQTADKRARIRTAASATETAVLMEPLLRGLPSSTHRRLDAAFF